MHPYSHAIFTSSSVFRGTNPVYLFRIFMVVLRRLKTVALIIGFLFIQERILPSAAFPADTCRLKIGMNIDSPSDWCSDWPFVDVMRYCRTWGTMDHPDYSQYNSWDTPYADSIKTDTNGYPLEIPFAVTGADTLQIVYTVWAHTRAMPLGIYTFLYDGDGDFKWDIDAHVQEIQQGRITVRIDSTNNIALLRILRSNPNNPVKNMRFLMPGCEETYQTQPFNPTFFEKLKPFKTIRFMGFGNTNGSPLEHWEERAHVDDYTYTTAKGVPYEWMIKLANATNSDAWINVPHKADSSFIEQMAILFRDGMNTKLKIYVEYTNEWWNWMFWQAVYLNQNGDQSVLWPERTAPFFARCMNIWKNIFASAPSRIERVFGTQHYWPDLGWRVLKTVPPGTFDAVSPAGYWGLNGDTLNALGASNTIETVIQNAQQEFIANAIPNWRQHKAMADSFHIRLHYYEGGQSFTPNPFGTTQPYGQVLMDIQTDPRMYDLYRQLLDTLQAISSSSSSLFCHFSLSSSKDMRYGCWGALENINQTPPYRTTAPKYQALLDYLAGSSPATPIKSSIVTAKQFRLLQNYPNPFNATTIIKYSIPQAAKAELIVYDVLGNRIITLVDDYKVAGDYEARWNAENCPSGVYFYQLRAGAMSSVKKLILLK
jgi:hypothetical protein